MQAASSETYRTRSNVFDSFRQIYHKEGWRGLYRVGVIMKFAALREKKAMCFFCFIRVLAQLPREQP